tara:strand:+ start:15630 stop:16922 length:1293 start_codon:yes stop_codon:yes gene_type:complete
MSWEPIYILLILFSTSIDYFLCRYLTASNNSRNRKIGLGLSVIMNLGLLFTFKYYHFFQEIMASILNLVNVNYQIRESSFLLPVGISFYTFQTLSYSIDVYRKDYRFEKHFGKFALFVSYFPQLIAGPIERASNLLFQLNKKEVKLKYEDFKDGALLFVWGLFKKVVVADNIRILADHYIDYSQFQNGGSIIFALLAFTVQIYADFSGYSDMAIGSSRMLGIKLSLNFRTPYFSQNITEFWRRWHITLSFWLRDYVFIPLGGSRLSKIATLRNLFITFFLAGIWHGASWNFLIWGCLHGIIVVIEKITGWNKNVNHRFFSFLKIVFTFGIITMTMLPVRSTDLIHLSDLLQLISNFHFKDFYLTVAENIYTPGAIGIAVLFLTDLFLAKRSILDIHKFNSIFKYSWVTVIIILILFIGDSSSEAFFYFQF